MATFSANGLVNGWIVRENLFDGAGSGDYGVNGAGAKFQYNNNWTGNNGTQGMQISGTGYSGSGNYAPDGNNSPSGIGFVNTLPMLPSLTARASWSPYT